VGRKSLNNFLKNWKITGYPKNLLVNVTPNKSSNYARRFLYSKLQAGRNKAPQQRPYGSKFANKHPWKTIINSLNSYNLSNAQKNMLRRINIAMAAQPRVSGLGGKRNAVNFNISSMNRNTAIQKQKNALEKAAREGQSINQNVFYNAVNNTKQQQASTRNNNLRTARQHREAFGN
jgi:hypothetical protein